MRARHGDLFCRVGLLRMVAGMGALALILGLVPSAFAYPRPRATERVSVASDGAEGNNGSSTGARISADGRYVAFDSRASNLIPDDTNNADDVFVHDRETGVTERISVASDGTEGSGASTSPAISADGRHVAFWSRASNIVAMDPGEEWTTPFVPVSHLFVHDRETGVTERVSVASDGTAQNERSLNPVISADGRHVAFQSSATNLVPGDTNGTTDIFVHDRETKTTERMSVASDGTEGERYSFLPAISDDGRYVAFYSFSSNLVPDDTNVAEDIFVHDRKTGITERVSVASDGAEGNADSRAPAISGDGRHVAFYSLASNFVPGDTNGASDIFVHDRETGVTERVSVASDGAQENRSAFVPRISGDGRHVTFHALGPSNVIPGSDTDVFVYDRETGITERVSVATDGGDGNDGSAARSLSADGRYVAFDSRASNLIPGDTNGLADVFVRDRGPTTGIGSLQAEEVGDSLMVSGWATFSGAPLSSGKDPADDGRGAGPLSARELGAEIVEASITHRVEQPLGRRSDAVVEPVHDVSPPQQGDLLLRIGLVSLPGVVTTCLDTCSEARIGAATPGVLYRWSFHVGDTAYEVRASRRSPGPGTVTGAAALTGRSQVDTHFALYECAPVCIETARLAGGIGTVGTEVRVSVPLERLDAEDGAELTQMAASAALGEAASGPLEPLDEVTLPDVTLNAPAVTLGIAPIGTSEPDVVFDTRAELTHEEFSGPLDLSSLPSGYYDVWARACIASVCGAASRSVTIGEAAIEITDTILELVVQGQGQSSALRARLAELDPPHNPIAERRIDFYSDSELIGSAHTDQDGVAIVSVPPKHRGANRTYQAFFAGDSFYRASADERTGQGR